MDFGQVRTFPKNVPGNHIHTYILKPITSHEKTRMV